MRIITAWMLGLVCVLVACSPAPLAGTLAPAVVDATEDAAAGAATLAPAVVNDTEDAGTEVAEPTTVPPTTVPTQTLPPIATLPPPTETPLLLSGVFVPGEVAVSGSFTLDPATGALRLSDDFKVAPGPDLFVVLSGADDLSLSFQAFSQQVLARPLLRLAALSSFTGAQSYIIPPGTDLSHFKTVVIWCNAFSVEFAAAPLNP